ncbi:MAG: hypothetical protein K2K80_07220 [Clostridia bacterium]|nr:hypothetical protein [Clostridia bacterium]
MEKLITGTTAYKIFSGDVAAKRLSHAYMLNFPDSKNMREALVIFARAFFNADKNSAEGERITNGSFTDFKLYPAPDKKFSAETVAHILDDCAMKPVEGRCKLYCIADFDSASALLQNKLLKTLEEPLEGIHFLLGVSSLAPVLDTVKSRVKLLEIPPFTEEQIYLALERRGHKEINAAAARSANGVLGVAENMADGGWFQEVSSAANEICRVTDFGGAGQAALKYGDAKHKTELLGEMQRLYFAALSGGGLPLTKPALTFALEKLGGAFADLKFNASFQGLLYDFLIKVVKENEKWLKLQA